MEIYSQTRALVWWFLRKANRYHQKLSQKVLGKSCVYLDELSTILTEIKSVINDRPLTYVSGDNGDPSPLTSSHLLYGRLKTQLPHDFIDDDDIYDPDFGNDPTALRKRAMLLDKLHQHF